MEESPPVHPTAVRLEASSACQLRCPECPTTQGRVAAGAVGRGTLRAESFRRLLDLNPSLQMVELSNWGEAFLNPELPAVLAAAHERDVTVTLGNGVNLNHASDEALEAVVRYRVRSVTVSIDGASQEVYEKYRVRGDLGRVLANIRRLNELKREFGSDQPLLVWQFVLFGHNQHEIAEARRLAREHAMAFAPKLNWSADYSPVRDPHVVKQTAEVAAATVEEHRRERGGEYLPACLQLWEEPQVNWDGKILGCCVNYWRDFGGNAFEQPIEIWSNGESIRYARAMLTGTATAKPDVPCSTCEVFERMRERGAWVTAADVEVRRAARERDATTLAQALRARIRETRSRREKKA